MFVKKNILFLFVCSIVFSVNSYASQPLPFDITPKAGTSLPTEVIKGETTTAFYTVTDKTGGPPPRNYVKHLPKNVTQVLVNNAIPDLCGVTFDLGAYGSCTLELLISGPVSSDCDDGRENPCLFVCMSDGFTCAGTKFPLNVIQVEAFPPLALAVGFNGANEQGITVSSSNNGQTWTGLQQSLTNFLVTASCSGGTSENICMTSGDSFSVPEIVYSNNGGASWNFAEINGLPDNIFFSNTDLSTCTGSGADATCMVAGSLSFNPGVAFFLAASFDRTTWDVVNTTGTTADDSYQGLSCTGSGNETFCFAVGTDNSTSESFTIASTNRGATWTSATGYSETEVIFHATSTQLHGAANTNSQGAAGMSSSAKTKFFPQYEKKVNSCKKNF